jgi:sigma-B regulation protein RsbU (phosphoserine phosphatase)
MFDFASYEAGPLDLADGDILVVYSDGLTDARNAADEMLGEARVSEIIRRGAKSGGCALERMLLDAIDEFTQGMPQTDDITLVVVEKY